MFLSITTTVLLSAIIFRCEGCGQSRLPPLLSNKVVGGRSAREGEYPWQVSIQRLTRQQTFAHYCGGTIISPTIVLTAAHCVAGVYTPYLKVVAGIQTLSDKDGQTMKVQKVTVHKQFNGKTYENDIALLRLAEPLSFNDRVMSACVPPPSREVTGFSEASGWGSTSFGSKAQSNPLKVAVVPIMSDTQCRRFYGRSAIDDKMLCAGFPSGGHDTCQGDSGGPLIIRRSGKAFIVGVVSWGDGCAQARRPGVYTQVTKYINWIKDNV